MKSDDEIHTYFKDISDLKRKTSEAEHICQSQSSMEFSQAVIISY